jgi:hypothetical protein
MLKKRIFVKREVLKLREDRNHHLPKSLSLHLPKFQHRQ